MEFDDNMTAEQIFELSYGTFTLANYNMIKNADDNAFKWIAILLNLIFTFNIIPKDFNVSIINPIKKRKKAP